MKNIEQIAAELQGYDPQALSADAVGEFLGELVQPVTESETLPLMQAHHRVLAADIVSPISVPPHDNSAMDGYALDGAQLQPGQPLVLQPVGGTAFAGKAWQGTVAPGQCVKIMTGAIMPAGLDTVVPQELTQTGPDGRITIPADMLQRGNNRRLMGEDLMQGRPALRAGQRLTPAALGLAASLGLPTVAVWRRLKVAYFSTGDEILSLGEPPREGAVYDSNRYTVFGLLQRMGCEVIDLGVVRDDPVLLEAAFRQATAQADAVITSGGVSVGEADHTKAMMRQLAADDPSGHSGVVFWRIAMRPGRPMAVGRIPKFQAKTATSAYSASAESYQKNQSDHPTRHAMLFGLPGNPVAVMVTFLAFVRPALLRMMGCTEGTPPLLKARSTEALRKKPGRTEYQRGTVTTAPDGGLQVRTTGNQGSGVLSSMVAANGLIVLHHHQGNVAVGDEVDVMLFDGVI
ncbi:MAG: molybdopterin molybdotransferase MoeA [Burkholderiaceae bacterium]|nr:molybdopterin molybdotransferase MoeA [Burkholderiaceae bacterium]